MAPGRSCRRRVPLRGAQTCCTASRLWPKSYVGHLLSVDWAAVTGGNAAFAVPQCRCYQDPQAARCCHSRRHAERQPKTASSPWIAVSNGQPATRSGPLSGRRVVAQTAVESRRSTLEVRGTPRQLVRHDEFFLRRNSHSRARRWCASRLARVLLPSPQRQGLGMTGIVVSDGDL